MVVGFGLGGRDVADRAEQAAVVVPVDPVHRGDFDGLQAAPWSPPVDHLGLEQADRGFGEGIVAAVADAADRGFDAGFDQALRVLDRDLLHDGGPEGRRGRSLWWTRPCSVGRRTWTACSSASSTNCALAVWLARQPTIRRANTSMTNAT